MIFRDQNHKTKNNRNIIFIIKHLNKKIDFKIPIKEVAAVVI